MSSRNRKLSRPSRSSSAIRAIRVHLGSQAAEIAAKCSRRSRLSGRPRTACTVASSLLETRASSTPADRHWSSRRASSSRAPVRSTFSGPASPAMPLHSVSSPSTTITLGARRRTVPTRSASWSATTAWNSSWNGRWASWSVWSSKTSSGGKSSSQRSESSTATPGRSASRSATRRSHPRSRSSGDRSGRKATTSGLRVRSARAASAAGYSSASWSSNCSSPGAKRTRSPGRSSTSPATVAGSASTLPGSCRLASTWW